VFFKVTLWLTNKKYIFCAGFIQSYVLILDKLPGIDAKTGGGSRICVPNMPQA
jgi:hypothetical protein